MTIFDLNHVEIISKIKQIKGGDSAYAYASTSDGSASASSFASTSDGTGSAIAFSSTSTSDVSPLMFTVSYTVPNTTMDLSIISVIL